MTEFVTGLVLFLMTCICILRILICSLKEKEDEKSLLYIKQAKAVMIALIVSIAAIITFAIFLTEMGF